MSVFDMLRDQLHMVFNSITDTMTGKVSLDRMTDFLRNVRHIPRISFLSSTLL